MSDYQISAIGHIQSPYKQKFAIPRQPRLVPEAKAKLIFAPDFNRALSAVARPHGFRRQLGQPDARAGRQEL